MGIFRNQKERIEALKGVTIFAGLPQADLKVIQEHVDESVVPKGTELAAQDRTPKQLVLLVTGSAEVKRNGRTIATLGPGDTIGELSLLDGGKQTATVVADEECEILAVPVSEFRVLLTDAPAFARKLLKSLAQRLREADSHLAP